MPPLEARLDERRHVASLLLGRRRDARHGIAVGACDRHGVANGKDVGMAGHGEIRLDLQTVGAVGGRVQPFRRARGAHAGGPDDGSGLQLVAAIDDAIDGTFGDGLPQHHLDADLLQRALRIGGEVFGKAGENARAGLDQDDAGLVGVDVAKVRRQRVLGEVGDGSRHFDAGRAGADDDEGQQRRAPRRIGLALGALEGDEDAPPQRGGILQRFQARRERLPFVVAEIGVAGAGGEHQRVIGQRIAVIEQHALSCRIDAADICEQRRHLLASAQQVADRPGDFRRRQRSGRDLVEQRLEQMMVAAVDQRDPDRRSGEAKGGLQPAETGADDHDVMGLFRRCRHGMQPRFQIIQHIGLCSHLRLRSKARLLIGR